MKNLNWLLAGMGALADYKQIAYNIQKELVTPEMIDDREAYLYGNVDQLVLGGGTAGKGDWVNVTYTVTDTETGEELDRSGKNGTRMKLGDYPLYEGMDDGIFGMETGETNTYTIDYIGDFQYQWEEEYAVKDRVVEYQVTLNGVYQIMPITEDPATDAYVSAYLSEATGCNTTAELRVYAEEQLEQEAEQAFQEERQNMVLTQLVKASEIEGWDENLEQYYYDEFWNAYLEAARDASRTIDFYAEMTGTTIPEIQAFCEKKAEYCAMADSLLAEVAEQEGLSDVDEALQFVLDNSCYDEAFELDYQLEDFYTLHLSTLTN